MSTGPALPTGPKVSGADLAHLPRVALGEGPLPPDGMHLIRRERDGLRFDALWAPQPGADRIVVLLSGDAPRARMQPPVFQRWSWGPRLGAHVLCISDPALWLDASLGLAWYAGTAAADTLPGLAGIVDDAAAGAGLGRGQAWTYGSSGGGFAALRLAAAMPGLGGAVALNPQTEIPRYHRTALVGRMLQVCFPGHDRAGARAAFPDRLSLLPHAEALRGRRVVLVQNRLDAHHLDEHYAPFCAALGVPAEAGETAGVTRILWDGAQGHAQAEPQAVIDRIRAIVGGRCAPAPDAAPDAAPAPDEETVETVYGRFPKAAQAALNRAHDRGHGAIRAARRLAERAGATRMIDAGAGAGAAAVHLSGAPGMAALHCLEPDPEAFALLGRAAALQPAPARFELHPVAASDRAAPASGDAPARAPLDALVGARGETLLLRIADPEAAPAVLAGARALLDGNRCLILAAVTAEGAGALRAALEAEGHAFLGRVAGAAAFARPGGAGAPAAALSDILWEEAAAELDALAALRARRRTAVRRARAAFDEIRYGRDPLRP